MANLTRLSYVKTRQQIAHYIEPFVARGVLEMRSAQSKLTATVRKVLNRDLPISAIRPVVKRYIEPVIYAADLKAYEIGWLHSEKLAWEAGKRDLDLKSLDLSKTQISHIQNRFSTDVLQLTGNIASELETNARSVLKTQIKTGAHVKAGALALQAVLGGPMHHAETLYRTQVQFAYGAGRWQSDQRKSIQSILWGYRYETVGDDRVRPRHKELQGVTLPKGNMFWQRFWTPNGWNCRCIIVPLFKPHEIVKAPQGAAPDEGFGFNLGSEF